MSAPSRIATRTFAHPAPLVRLIPKNAAARKAITMPAVRGATRIVSLAGLRRLQARIRRPRGQR